MALENQTTVWLALATALVAIVLMWRLTRSPKAKATPAAAGPEAASPQESMLLRFVVDEKGERTGETVAVDGSNFILKRQDGFYAVPMAQVESAGDQLRLKGTVDWEAAKREGEAWRERSHKVISYAPEELPKDES